MYCNLVRSPVFCYLLVTHSYTANGIALMVVRVTTQVVHIKVLLLLFQ